MAELNKKENTAGRVSRFPEQCPVDENGREILVSLKNVDITL